MKYREYGGTGVMLSVIGFGGICVMDENADDARRIVDHARERGINYFDVAPQYGNAEEMLGPALEPHRDGVFLACKTLMREADAAREDLNRSLQRLRTDHFDLYQLHAIETEDDVDRLLAPGGTVELLTELKASGRARHVGFSAHNEDVALRLLDAYTFDSVLFPINWLTWYRGGIGRRLVESAALHGTEVLALKSLAMRRWTEKEERTWSKTWYRPAETPAEVTRGVRFTLSCSVVAAVSPGHEELLWMACDAADTFEPLSEEENRALEREAKAYQPIFSRTVTAI